MKATKVKEIRQEKASTTLEELVLSGHFGEAERLSETLPATTVRTAALKAQVLIYKGELEEAAEVLAPFENKLTEANLTDAAEFGLARAELAYWRGEYEEAEKHAQVVYGIFSLNNDLVGLARSLYMLGRIQRRLGNFDRAKQYMLQALDYAQKFPSGQWDFLVGLISFNLGETNRALGHFKEARAHFLKAIDLLKSEGGRYYGLALNGYGTLLLLMGQYEEAAELIQQAYSCFSIRAFFDDLAHATNNLAYAFIRLGRFDEARQLLQESLELRRRSKDIAGESGTLELIGKLHFEQGRFEEAQRVLMQAVEMADLARNPHEKAVALITLGRVKMARGELDAARHRLEEALNLAIELKNESLQAEAHTYLAELCVLQGNGMAARDHLKRSKSLMNGYSDAYLLAQRERIERRVEEEKVKAHEGVFTINSSFLPTWREAHESLGKFLLVEALKHAGGNQTQAAELLGVTKAYITLLRKKYGI